MSANADELVQSGAAAPPVTARTGFYAWYALAVLVIVYMLNFVDRQILAILAEDIKADLQLTDPQLGFLYGTSFAIFYTLFGFPLGRLADSWYRGRLVALGITLWSVMTALSGFAKSFPQLATARVGVGIGEASASPAAFSLLADYFPKEKRGLAMAIYSAGIFLGIAVALPMGGLISHSWNAAFPDRSGPLGLAGWQATFLAVGIPGLLVALLVALLREPLRGAQDGHPSPVVRPGAWAEFGREMISIVPPLTLISVARMGVLPLNLMVAAGIAAGSALLIWLTGDVAQWAAYGIGVYAVFSWTQRLKVSDPPTWTLIWGTGTVVLAVAAFGMIAINFYVINFWVAPYAIRTFHLGADVVGLYVGLPGALGAFAGTVLGGRMSDWWKPRDPRGRVFVCMLAVVLPLPFAAVQFTTADFTLFALINPVVYMFSNMWIGSAVATYQDCVLPRMRGTVGATYLLGSTMVGLALGPYGTGKVAAVTGSLQAGVFSSFALVPITLLLLWQLARRIERTEATKVDRARTAGEGSLPVPEATAGLGAAH
jgi:MFS family permease